MLEATFGKAMVTSSKRHLLNTSAAGTVSRIRRIDFLQRKNFPTDPAFMTFQKACGCILKGQQLPVFVQCLYDCLCSACTTSSLRSFHHGFRLDLPGVPSEASRLYKKRLYSLQYASKSHCCSSTPDRLSYKPQGRQIIAGRQTLAGTGQAFLTQTQLILQTLHCQDYGPVLKSSEMRGEYVLHHPSAVLVCFVHL